MKKDRATEYWSNEIKRAEENTRLAYRNYTKARRDEGQALQKLERAKENHASREEREPLFKEVVMASAQVLTAWKRLNVAQKWERVTKEAARQ